MHRLVRGMEMSDCCDALALTTAVSTLATAIAAQVQDTEELSLLAAVLVQLGDTLATIAVRRTVCADK